MPANPAFRYDIKRSRGGQDLARRREGQKEDVVLLLFTRNLGGHDCVRQEDKTELVEVVL